MNDKMLDPLEEQEFIEIIVRNRRHELRYELLHVKIPSITILRTEVRKHGKFHEEIKHWQQRPNLGIRRQICEVEAVVEQEPEDEIYVR